MNTRTPKMILNWTGMQSVIVHAVDKPGGASWREIKEAVLSEGWNPTDWMTQVRGPLQGLLDEGIIRRVDRDNESERYVLNSAE
jgi:hypothetical protein